MPINVLDQDGERPLSIGDLVAAPAEFGNAGLGLTINVLEEDGERPMSAYDFAQWVGELDGAYPHTNPGLDISKFLPPEMPQAPGQMPLIVPGTDAYLISLDPQLQLQQLMLKQAVADEARDAAATAAGAGMSLGDKITLINTKVVAGVLNWLGHGHVYHLHDDKNEMAELLYGRMMDFYRWEAQQLPNILGHWQTIQFGKISAKAAVGQFDTGGGPLFSTAWWLGGSHDVFAQGSFDVRRSGNNIVICNISVHWEWDDVIEANSFGTHNGNIQNNKVEWFVEGTYHLIADDLFGNAWPLAIDWTDIRSDEIPLIPAD
jgi:hypothetical protein